jgi:hypothetical protein
MWGATKWLSSLILASHTRGVTVTPDPPTGFKSCENVGLPVVRILSLFAPGMPGLPCGYGFWLSYSLGSQRWSCGYFLFFSV